MAEQPESQFDVVLKSRVLRGTVVDPNGDPIEGALVSAGGASATSERDGSFVIRGAEQGEVVVARPAWLEVSFTMGRGSG